jgi:hypothetical protein
VYQKGDNSNLKKNKFCANKKPNSENTRICRNINSHISVKSRLKCDINFINFTLDLKRHNQQYKFCILFENNL